MSYKICCVPGCNVRSGEGIQMHTFPNPEKDYRRFTKWVEAIRGEVLKMDSMSVYKRRRVCRRHFSERFHYESKIVKYSVPELHLSQKDSEEDAVIADKPSADEDPDEFDEPMIEERLDEESIAFDEPVMESDHDSDGININEESNEVKEEVSYLQVCRCCLGENELENLWDVHTYGNHREVYGRILKYCFGIELVQMKNDRICKECIRSLHEANAFKNVVLNVQEQLTGVNLRDAKKNKSTVIEFINRFQDELEALENAEKANIERDMEEENYPTEYLESDLELGGEEVVQELRPVEKSREKSTLPSSQPRPKIRPKAVQPRKSNFKIVKVVKRRVLPSRETLIRAVRAVKEGKMTLSAAKKLYDINGYCLRKIIESDIDLENIDLSLLTARKDKIDSVEMLKMSTDFVKQGKLTKVEAASLFNIPLSTLDYRISKGFLEDRSDQLIDTERIDRNGVTIVEVDDKVSRDPDRFTRADRLRLEQDVKMILACTNATPYLVLREKFVCGYCNDTFEVPDELRCHVLIHGSIRDDVDVLLRPAEVKEIMRLDIQDLKCVVCNLFLSWEDLYAHLEEHGVPVAELSKKRIVPFDLVPYKYKCVFCDVSESRYMKLEVHMSVHFDNYICDDCGHSFMTYSKLKTHEYQEKQKRLDFKCEMCEEMIIGRTNFEKHMATAHSSPIKFSCKHCNEKFKDQYRRHLHMVEKHKHKLVPIKCEDCDKEFLWKGFYLQHYRKVHLNEQKYECGVCGKRFFATHSYKKHLMTHRKKRVQCEQCSSLFTDEYSFEIHTCVSDPNIHGVLVEEELVASQTVS